MPVSLVRIRKPGAVKAYLSQKSRIQLTAVPIIAEPLTLHLRTPFRIAYGSSTVRENVLVRIGDGVGEGALPPYYAYRIDEVLAYLQGLDADRLLGNGAFYLEDALDLLPPGPAPARAAADIALHDHWGRTLGFPLYQLWGLNPASAPVSSITLSIPETLDALRTRARSVADLPLLKLKLGSGSLERDEQIVRTVREETRAQVCVDANGSWSVEEAVMLIPRLGDLGVLFVEQPIAAGDHESWRRLRASLPPEHPTLIADESIQQPADVLALADSIDGINIKLTKTGGIRGARRMIELARALGLSVMLGCMIESSVAITAAAHLAPLVDFADLDGNIDLVRDPFSGMKLVQGQIHLPTDPGLGVTPDS